MEILSAVFLPVFLGASHVLEPGHGKTALTLFAAGASRVNSRFVYSLVGGIVVSHTLVLLITALALHMIAFGEDTFRVMHGVFGLFGGALLFWVAYRVFMDRKGAGHEYHGSGCSCPAHAKSPSSESSPADGSRGEARTVGLIGMGGGLLPCPTAVAAFMTSLASGAILEGVVAIFAFVGGMVVTLVGLALGANYFGSRFFRVTDANQGRYAYGLAGAIGLAGVMSLFLSMREFGVMA